MLSETPPCPLPSCATDLLTIPITTGTWRWIGLICGIWNAIGLVMVAVFYFPPPRVNSTGMSRREVIAQIDFVGGFLSIFGMILFMAGMQWGGYQYSWGSAHVLAPLILGAVMLVAFMVWEGWGAKHPMFPKRLRQDPRILGLTLVITFISGANFVSLRVRDHIEDRRADLTSVLHSHVLANASLQCLRP